jgi:hypothetical protein
MTSAKGRVEGFPTFLTLAKVEINQNGWNKYSLIISPIPGRIGIGLMVQSDKKNDQIRSLRRYQIRSLIKDHSPIRTLTSILDLD